jgi:hypothetical protein
LLEELFATIFRCFFPSAEREFEYIVRVCAPGPPDDAVPEVSTALADVLRSPSTVELNRDLTVRPSDEKKLNVVREGSKAQALEPLFSVTARQYIDRAHDLILLPDSTLAEEPGAVSYTDPILKNDRRRMIDLIRRLRDLGLVVFRRRRIYTIGIFCVAKKNDQLRLVFDCRPANQRCRTRQKRTSQRHVPSVTCISSRTAAAFFQCHRPRRLFLLVPLDQARRIVRPRCRRLRL